MNVDDWVPVLALAPVLSRMRLSSFGLGGRVKGDRARAGSASAEETRGGGSCSVRPLASRSGRRMGRGVAGRAWSSLLRWRSLNSGDGWRATEVLVVLVGGSEKLRPDLEAEEALPDVVAAAVAAAVGAECATPCSISSISSNAYPALKRVTSIRHTARFTPAT